jgi:NitT/TauT family transport system permease protein
MATEALPAPPASPTPRRRRPLRIPINFSGILFLIALVGVWQLAMSTGVLTSTFLPQPHEIGSAIVDLTESGEMTSNLWHTVYVTLIGWSLAGLIGLTLGLVIGLSMEAWRYSMATFEFFRALPGIAFVPVAVLLFGFSVKMELIVVTYVSVWPVLVNAVHGVRQVTPLHNDVARMMGMSRWARICRFVIPTMAPYVVVGLQISLSLSLALALVSEMVGNPTGVGQALIVAQNTFHPEQMFAYVIVIGMVGVLLNWAFLKLLDRGFPGTMSNNSQPL